MKSYDYENREIEAQALVVDRLVGMRQGQALEGARRVSCHA